MIGSTIAPRRQRIEGAVKTVIADFCGRQLRRILIVTSPCPRYSCESRRRDNPLRRAGHHVKAAFAMFVCDGAWF